MKKTIAIIGVGYVGLELAMVFSRAGFSVVAYDCNVKRIQSLHNQIDDNNEVGSLHDCTILFTHEMASLADATHYIIAVPTPTIGNVPDLSPLKNAVGLIGDYLKKGDLVVLESTVYPGTTDEVVIPILEQKSGLKSGVDFFVGYCPERIVPGSEKHETENFCNVVSGQNEQALKRVIALYEKALSGHIYAAPTMKVAEASKLIENIQRDVSIALLNEYAEVMEKMNRSIRDVLDAARTKWNFLSFKPGLVGGHCIPIDPWYLVYQANKLGIKTPLITTTRQVNDQFVYFISDMVIKLLNQQGFSVSGAKVAILGLSFKPNVTDTRNTQSVNLYKILQSHEIEVLVYDPIAIYNQPDINRVNWDSLPDCHAIVLVQDHAEFIQKGMDALCEKLIQKGVFVDLPAAFSKQHCKRSDIAYWCL